MRVRDLRACDSQALVDLFPTLQALRQRLWRLVRNRCLAVHRIGNRRAYSLGRMGLRVLGLRGKEVRIAPTAVARHVLYSQAWQLLLSEGFVLDGELQFGRTRVLRTRLQGRPIAVAVCGARTSVRSVQPQVARLLGLVNPFAPKFDQLVIFCPPHHAHRRPQVPKPYRDRIVYRSLPPGQGDDKNRLSQDRQASGLWSGSPGSLGKGLGSSG